MDIEYKIRKIAKSVYWQTIYNNSLKSSGIRLFNNETNLSGLQTRLLYWLSTYKTLYDDLSTFEDEYLTNKVIENDYRTDAYLIYKNKKNEHDWKQYRFNERVDKLKNNRTKQWQNPGKETNISVELRREE